MNSYYSYIIPFIVSFIAVAVITPLIKRFATKRKILDSPKTNPERKIQKSPVPLLGGLAIFIGFAIVLIYYTYFTDRILGGYMLEKHIVSILIAGALLMIGGYLDDKYNLKPYLQLIWPILAGLVIIAAGIGIPYISSPFGGTLHLDTIKIELFKISDIPYSITLWADLIAFVWLMVMVYTTKFLDGLDGLVPGIGTIGAIIIFALSLTNDVAQPETALLSVIFAGALAGFLIFSFHPARIFLGEGGSTFIGFMLGVLAIISGAKIATALLIMGVPLLDVAWVILRRVFKEKRSPFWGDKKHLHFRLLDIGLSHRQTVSFLYAVTGAFGLTSLFLSTKGKLIALIVLVIAMILLAFTLVLIYKRKRVHHGS
jgi:UDP-GlcNAc:undecaprenyl-phosphate/decaprenyl-phosphate GlcNAc-1-phosphate transferase